ncbi:MAG TPA: hypothetical protein DCE23_09345 [Firmicutes bacterium]|nr:hypothetical protein [Bacillota bacterium]
MNDDKNIKPQSDTNQSTSKKSPIIPGTKKEAEFYKDNSNENNTIMPTMIDESEEYVEKKQDLSAIIPQFTDDSGEESATELVSKDNMFKSDASITLAVVNESGEATMSSGAKLPDQIDMEQRKKEIEASKNVKKAKKKEKRDRRRERKRNRQQNIISLASLIIMIALGIFGYWYFNHKTEEDFLPKTLEIQIGESLPIQKLSYITPGVGNDIEEILYNVDTSNVVLEEIGEYSYTVTYKGIKKNGIIKIVDKEGPELEVRNVTITEGGQYKAETFVKECRDPTGCNYSFQDAETEQKYTAAGSYVVYIVATDAYQNRTTKKASLIIEAEGNVRRYVKNTGFNQTLGYEVTEIYELHFSEYNTYGILITGTEERTFTYQDVEKYEEDRKKFQGELGYSFSDSEMKIIYKKSSNTVGNNYSNSNDIDAYLTREGFRIES